MKIRLLPAILPVFFINYFYFQLNAQVQANFTPLTVSGCSPLVVPYTNTSTGGPTGYVWDFGNGSTSTLTNPSATFINNGNTAITYTIKLTAFKPGSYNSKTGTVTVFPKPKADFTHDAMGMTTCVGQEVHFTDNSTPPVSAVINSRTWDFGDGYGPQLFQTTAVSHTYTSPGTFPVSLLIEDSNGCKHSKVVSVVVIPAPVASFTTDSLFSCISPLYADFTNNSTVTGTASYLWNFGDSTSGVNDTSTDLNPSHTYTSGVYTVTLTVKQYDCADTEIKTAYIVVKPHIAEFIADTAICFGDSVQFFESSPSVSWLWDFDDPNSLLKDTSTAFTPWHTFTAPGSYSVNLLNAIDVNGCVDSTTIKIVNVYDYPVADYKVVDVLSCSYPFTVNFTDSTFIPPFCGSIAQWYWDFGDPSSGINNTSILSSLSHTYNNYGYYPDTFIVTSVHGCADTLLRSVLVQRPDADFAEPHFDCGYFGGCAPFAATFLDSSKCATDSIVSYLWDFGDTASGANNTSTLENPVHVYNDTGVFTVTLIVTTLTGCKDTMQKVNYAKIGTRPIAEFMIVDSTPCFAVPAECVNLTTGPYNLELWNFGGFHLPALPTPEGPCPMPFSPFHHPNPFNYALADKTYNITLIVAHNGCPDTVRHDSIVTVIPAQPSFDYTIDCDFPYVVEFDDWSIDADSIFWNFGDGTTLSNVDSPIHTYTSRGYKKVSLYAINDSTHCASILIGKIKITDPIADIYADPGWMGCDSLYLTFKDTSQDCDWMAYWDFGDGTDTTLYSHNPSFNPLPHFYDTLGVYEITLWIIDSNDCEDEITIPLRVVAPRANFSVTDTAGCTPFPAVFNDLSYSDLPIYTWIWNFGDGNTQSTPNNSITYIYTDPGIYTITMIAIDSFGCRDTITKEKYVAPTFPYFDIVADTFVCTNALTPFGITSAYVAMPASFIWDFGDGSLPQSSSTGNIDYTYSIEGWHTVSLTITDRNGCTDTMQKPIFVQVPIANFNDLIISEECGVINIQFNDQSTGAHIIGWQWDFGDGATSTLQNPVHSYTVAGTYLVTLVSINVAGCRDTIMNDSLIVVPGPMGTFSFTPDLGCNPLTVTFTASSNNSEGFFWDFGDGNVMETDKDDSVVTHTYFGDIKTTPVLLLTTTLTDGTPCQLPAPSTDTVQVITAQNVTILEPNDTLAEGDTISLHSLVSSVSGIPYYLWEPAGNLNCDTCPNTVFTADGTGNMTTLILEINDTGCVAKDTIYIYNLFCEADLYLIPNVFTPNEDGINDLFDINKGFCVRSTYQLRIFDRWGLEMFSSTDRNSPWNGKTKNGNDAPDGVYYYIVTADKKTYTGFLHLFR